MQIPLSVTLSSVEIVWFFLIESIVVLSELVFFIHACDSFEKFFFSSLI